MSAKKIHLKKALLFSFFTVSIIPIVIFSFILIHRVNTSIRNDIEKKYRTVSELIKNKIEYLEKNFETNIRFIARTKLEKIIDREDIQTLFKDYIEKEIGFSALYILDKDKNIKESFYNDKIYEGIRSFKPSLEKDELQWSKPFMLPNGKMTTSLILPYINPQNKEKIYLVGFIDLSVLQPIVESIKFGQTGIVYISDEEGNLIAHPDIELVRQQENVTILIFKAREANSNIFIYKKDSEKRIVYWTALQNGWNIFIDREYSEVYGIVHNLITLIIVITAILAIFIILLSIKISNYIVKPIEKLILQTKLIANGDYTEIEIPANRGYLETIELISQFNIMIDTIQENIKKIRHSNEKFKRLFHSNPEAIAYLDKDFHILDVNPRFEKLFGYSLEDIEGKLLDNFIFPENELETARTIRTKSKDQFLSMEIICKTKDKKLLNIIFSSEPIKDEEIIKGYIVVYKDITEHKIAEEERRALELQLHHAQKMQAIGELAGGIAHDFNNLLMGIMGAADILKYEYADKMNKKDNEKDNFMFNLNLITKESERAAKLTSQLLAFARKGKYQQIPIDIHNIINEVISILSQTIDRRIEIKQHLDAEHSITKGDPNQLQQSLLNIAVNARDAMPNGGKLVFATSIVSLDEGYCNAHFEVSPGQYICISISDTGIGMDKNIQERIFEPFFTTKENGTGLGLAMVFGTIKNHGGYITLHSNPNKGTIFNVYLPLCKQEKIAHIISKKLQIVPGSGTILLVDDESFVLEVASNMLKKLGYEVITCNDGQKAIKYYKSCYNNVDVVIIDMIMPKLNGQQVLLELKKINPRVKAIIASGYSMDDSIKQVLNNGALGFIQKPFKMNELSSIIAQALSITKLGLGNE